MHYALCTVYATACEWGQSVDSATVYGWDHFYTTVGQLQRNRNQDIMVCLNMGRSHQVVSVHIAVLLLILSFTSNIHPCKPLFTNNPITLIHIHRNGVLRIPYVLLGETKHMGTFYAHLRTNREYSFL